MNPGNCVFSVSEAMLQLGVTDERLVHALLHPTPDPVVDRTVRRPQIGGDKLWFLML